MPFSGVSEAVKKHPNLDKYSAKAKSAWVSSFNSAMKSGKDEGSSFAIAYSVANKVDGKKAGMAISEGELADNTRNRDLLNHDLADDLKKLANRIAGVGELKSDLDQDIHTAGQLLLNLTTMVRDLSEQNELSLALLGTELRKAREKLADAIRIMEGVSKRL